MSISFATFTLGGRFAANLIFRSSLIFIPQLHHVVYIPGARVSCAKLLGCLFTFQELVFLVRNYWVVCLHSRSPCFLCETTGLFVYIPGARVSCAKLLGSLFKFQELVFLVRNYWVVCLHRITKTKLVTQRTN
jgi:hypothetical protein